ncbi:MAG: AraC family transcriptional regulator, partial [Hyphomicrobium sp.]|nr:AraC family transcriptional regulator [Hyphomicrobium sp.]
MNDVSTKLSTIRKIGFLTLDEYTMIAVSSAIEVLRMANRLSGQTHYSWTIITTDGQPVPSSNGMSYADAATYDAAGDLDMVLVCGGTNVANFVNDKVVNLLRRIARDGVVLGGLCTGTFALVKSGLLDGYKCTIHWENMAGLR